MSENLSEIKKKVACASFFEVGNGTQNIVLADVRLDQCTFARKTIKRKRFRSSSRLSNAKNLVNGNPLTRFLNTADIMDTTADAMQKAVHTVTLNLLM